MLLQCKKHLTGWVLVLIAMFAVLAPTPSFASDTDVLSSTYIAVNDPNVHQIITQSNTKAGVDILGYDAKKGTVTFNYTLYVKLPDSQGYLEDTLSIVSSSGLGEQRKSKLFNFIARQDGSSAQALRSLQLTSEADLYKAQSALRWLTSPLGTLVGFITLAIFAGMTLSVVFDISLLTSPALQYFTDTHPDKGILFSSTAKRAVQIESTQGTPAITYWVKRRIGAYVIIGGILSAILTGYIFDMMATFLSIFGI